MAIRITALGTVGVERDGQLLDRFPAQRVRFGLLVYLAVERQAARETVMGVFWPDRPPEKARRLLNQTLYELRQDLGEDRVRTVGEQLVVADDIAIDVLEMARAVEDGDHARALALCGGRFLAGSTLGGTRELEGWIDGQQARITRLHRQARRGAIDRAVDAGDLEGALAVARGWVEMDALDDEGQHRLIELLAATGDRAGALRQYASYAALVAEELELEPLEETQALVERIRQGEVGDRPAAPVPTAVLEERRALVPGGALRSGGGGVARRPSSSVWLPVAAGVALLGVAAFLGRTLLPAEREELDPRRIAVLFFDDHSPEQDLGPLAAGFTEALIHEFDQVDGLEVLSVAAVEAYRTSRPTLDSIVRDLRAGTLVEGSLTRAGDTLRIAYQLIDGKSGTNQLSGTLSRPASEAQTIVRDLPVLVAFDVRKRLGRVVALADSRRQANSDEAWELVQHARLIIADERVVNDDDLSAAASLLRRADSLLVLAERLDPNWPAPAVYRARVAGMRAKVRSTIPGRYDPDIAREAISHTSRVLHRFPDYGPALEERGLLRFELAESPGTDPAEAQRLYREAEADLRAAVRGDPQHAKAWWALSRVLRRNGSLAEAKQAARRAIAADVFLEVPSEGLFQLFQMSLELEHFAEASEWCNVLHDRYPQQMRWVQCELALLASSPLVPPDAARGWLLVDSIAVLGSAEHAVTYRDWATLYVAKTLARSGLADSARAVVQRTFMDPMPSWTAYDMAHLHVLLAEDDKAIELLQVYAGENPALAASLATDWWFRPLHGDRRLDLLVRGTTVLREAER